MVTMSKAGRGWALFTVHPGLENKAFKAVLDLALQWQWKAPYQIKRVDMVKPLTREAPAYSLFVAVKTDSAGQLQEAFDAILETVTKNASNQPPAADRCEALNSIEIDW